jgi:uncharacterized protein with GYD domain
MKGDSSMPTYIVLTNFTQQGIANIKESPGRLDAAKAAVKAMGENSNIEAPDDESIAKLALAIGSQGSIRTETLRAFTEDEYRQIIAGLS